MKRPNLHLRSGQIYILPTPYGLIYAALIITLLLLAAIYANNLVYLLTFLILVLGLLSMVQTHNNLKALKIQALSKVTLPAQSTTRLSCTLLNSSGDPKLAVDLLAQTSAQHKIQGLCQWIGAHSAQKVPLTATTQARGVDRLQRLRLSTRHPMGLFRSWCWLDLERDLFIYPKPQGTQPLPRDHSTEQGELHGLEPGTEDFAEHEKYHRGLSHRRIDWRVYARQPRTSNSPLLSKKFLNELAPSYRLDWDLIDTPQKEKKLSQLSQWLETLQRAQTPYSFHLPGFHLPAGHSEAHRQNCLKKLAAHAVKLDPDAPR